MINVSIVTYHTDNDELKRCLDSLRSGIVSKIYVIDNSRSEKTRLCLEGYDNVEYIPNDNVGYGAGHNIALRKTLADAEVDCHLVLNSDVFFQPVILDRICQFMSTHPEIGMIHPKLTDKDGTLQYTARALPTPFDLILRRFLPANWFRKSRDRYLLKDIDHEKPFEAPYFQGSFMMISCEALRNCGLFDERFFMYPEDIDLSRRIHKVARTLYWPQVNAVHDHRRASYHSGKMMWIHIINMIRYFNKWGWIFDNDRKRINRSIHND